VKAIVLEAEWSPRDGAKISEADEARRWAYNANLAYRDPRVSLKTVDEPGDPGEGEVLVKVGACGICGSDLHMYETDDAGYVLLPYHVKAPVVLGHEFAGTVAAVGPGVEDFGPGDLITVEEIQYCGECLACRGGFPNSCERIEDLGFTINGGFAAYVKVPAKACWSLNSLLERYGTEEKALEVGAMCEPVSVAYEGMFTRAGGFKPGGSAAVFGAGPIGLAAVALAAAAGASRLLCVETVPERRDLAMALGATDAIDPRSEDPAEVVREITRGRGVAMAVEASGNWPAVMPAIEDCLAVGGKVSVLGMDARLPQLDLGKYQLRAGGLFGSVGHAGGWNFPNVIALMASGKIRMENAVTKKTDLEGMVDALDSMEDRTDGKILIKPEGAA
jgi:threonine dehydrogenase-like Zn-dependent dehydrogenase